MLQPAMILVILAYLGSFVVMRAPDSPLAVGMSFFPTMTPFAMMLRMVMPPGPPVWQVALAVADPGRGPPPVFMWAAGRIFRDRPADAGQGAEPARADEVDRRDRGDAIASIDADVIVAGAGPAGAVAARTLAAAGIRHAARRSRGVSAQQAVRRRHESARAATVSLARRRAGRRRRPSHLAAASGRARRASSLDIESPDPCVLLIRRVEFDHALVRAAVAAGAPCSERFEITQVEADADGVTLQARDGRRLRAPIVVAADGVHSVHGEAARRERAVAAREHRHRHDGGDAGRDAPRRSPGRALGRVRVQRPRRLCLRVSRRRTTSTSGSAACCRITRARCPAGRTSCSRRSSAAWSAKACSTANRIAGTSRRF